MTQGRRVLLYFSWSRPAETGAPLASIDDRFPALFELRRMLYPRLEAIADAGEFDPGIGGFLDHVQRPNFAAFSAQASRETGHDVLEIERVDDGGVQQSLDDALLGDIDTVIIIGFDSLRTGQVASAAEVAAVSRFLSDPDHLMFVCVHHDIGETNAETPIGRVAEQAAEYYHHGDRAIPPRQGFGGFGRSLLAALGVPVINRFGLRPAAQLDGSPQPIVAERALDRLGLLDGVDTFNLHPHLPHLERMGDSAGKLDVLARQAIDVSAPSHPFVRQGNASFDALLQSRADVFAGTLLVSDTTLWSSTAGGLGSLRRLWSNVVTRSRR
jgi:hypothetical protein